MQQIGVDGLLKVRPKVLAESVGSNLKLNSIGGLLNSFGRLSLALTTIIATSTASMSPNTAIAASHHDIHAAHSSSSSALIEHHRSKRLARNLQAHSRLRATVEATHHSGTRRHAGADRHAAPGRLASNRHAGDRYTAVRPRNGAAHSANPPHRDSIQLANATWDNPEVPPAVLDAIQAAARESGVDPHLLAAMAWRESRFDVKARSRRSSAKGLLQFTTGTWLQMVRDYGSQHDVAAYAAAIHTNRSGDLSVSNRPMRDAILQLRNDPILSAKLAAENMMRQRAAMQTQLKRRMRPADLYLIHVLGPTGATRFLTAVSRHPKTSSLNVASLTVMRNAGLVTRDGQVLSVGDTYTATQRMLTAQRTHSAPLLTASKTPDNITPPVLIPVPIQVSEMP